MTGKAILDLRDDFGLTKRELINILKASNGGNAMIGSRLPKWLKESIYRQSINHKVDNPLGVEVADAILRLRRTWMEAFVPEKVATEKKSASLSRVRSAISQN